MTTDQHKRIAKNTLMLYARQILTLVISLYALRVTLNVLGVEDYGVYNAVAGVVAMALFLSKSMASATQRFFSFALGTGDEERLNRTFVVNWVIYAGIAIAALVLLESIGLWFVSDYLKIPPERVAIAHWVYQFSVFTFVLTIISTPFTAIIIAHEDMHIHAYISIVEALLRLIAVVMLMYIPWEKLSLYAFLLLVVAAIRTVLYVGICNRKYRECQYRKFYWDKALLYEVLGFTGWTLFGQFTLMGRTQAVTILLNQVFNPTVVAARAIANSVSLQIAVFSGSFNLGLYPPIIKSYASGDKEALFSLIFNGCKITFYLMWIFALPLFLLMDSVLHLWLGIVPAGAVLFTRLALVEALINSICGPIITAARAPGRMKLYELTMGMIQLGTFFAAWIALREGAEAYSVYVIAIVANVIMFAVRLVIVKSLIGMSLRAFFVRTLVPITGVVVLSLAGSLLVHRALPDDLLSSAVSGISSMAITAVCVYFVGLNRYWREKTKEIVCNRLNRLLKVVFR